MYAKKNSGKKVIALLLILVLLIGVTIGGTVAYLMTQSDEVTNTFVIGNIGTLTLTETKGNKFTIIPGKSIEKDPVVTFNGNNVAAYVFLKVDAAGWTVSGSETTYTYTIGTGEKEMKWTLAGWAKLEDGVYYRAIEADADTATISDSEKYAVIKDNTITVGTGITQAELNGGTYTKALTFTAYAIQQDSFNGVVSEAWKAVKPN